MAPREKTKEQIDTIILEQYLQMINPDLRSWILESSPASTLQAVELAEAYASARQAEGTFELGKCSVESHQHTVQ